MKSSFSCLISVEKVSFPAGVWEASFVITVPEYWISPYAALVPMVHRREKCKYNYIKTLEKHPDIHYMPDTNFGLKMITNFVLQSFTCFLSYGTHSCQIKEKEYFQFNSAYVKMCFFIMMCCEILKHKNRLDF